MSTDAQLRLEGALKVVEWMRVKNREEGCEYDFDRLATDLHHSALIRWLCEGNEPLPHRPPVRFSRPHHQVVVDGRFEPRFVHLPWEGYTYLVVDQDGWNLIETKGNQDWIAAYKIGGTYEAPTWSEPWSIKRLDDGWIAERLP